MTKMPIRSNSIADKSLELGKLGKSASDLTGPYGFILYSHLEDAASARYKRHFAELIFEGDQQLLRHPRGAKKPSTLHAVLDL
jgi:hypothetical protein